MEAAREPIPGCQAAVVASRFSGHEPEVRLARRDPRQRRQVVISTSSVFGIKRARSPLRRARRTSGCFAMDTAAASR